MAKQHGRSEVPIEVTMPKLSPTMETGVITQWLVKVGDAIKEGDVLADIETDKATMQMKAYDDGIVVHIDHRAGEEVALGQRVMVLARQNEDPKQVASALGLKGSGSAAPSAGSAPSQSSAPAKGEAGARAREATDGPARGAPPAAPAAQSSGNGEQAAAGEREPEAVGRRLKVSPLARKMASSSSVDLGQVRGSGPGGRIIRRDIEAVLRGQVPAPKAGGMAAAASAPLAPSNAPAASPAVSQPSLLRPAAPSAAAQRIPHSRMRKTIAQRMVQAKQAAPEIHLTVDIRADRLVTVRDALNQRLAAEGIKLSIGDFVTKAVAISLRIHPGLNATYEPDAIVRHGEVNIGIAVALDEGLIVPVIRGADTLGLREIRLQSTELAAAARAKTLQSEQLTSGTFTISNLGMYGTRQFDAILNMPEVAILAVGAALKQPVVEGDQLRAGTVMSVTLTADHRAVDGAMAAEFLGSLKALLEEPAAMLL
jgi:pyruvate dehydrogenase E2 component (dihydrolipoamide acetyltransferase)